MGKATLKQDGQGELLAKQGGNGERQNGAGNLSNVDAANLQKTQGNAKGNASSDLASVILSHESSNHGGYDAFNIKKGGKKYYSSKKGDLINGKTMTSFSLGEMKSLSNSRQTFTITNPNRKKPLPVTGILWAAGRYQIVPGTLKGIRRVTDSFNSSTPFNKSTQDICFESLISGAANRKRGVIKTYLDGGDATVEQAARQVAMEWSSIGIKPGSVGHYKKVGNKKGTTSYYYGDGVHNHAPTTYYQIVEALKKERTERDARAKGEITSANNAENKYPTGKLLLGSINLLEESEKKQSIVPIQKDTKNEAEGKQGAAPASAKSIDIPNGYITQNFKWSEFSCHNGDPVPDNMRDKTKKLCKNLETIREAFGNKRITITSGYRSKRYNDKLVEESKKKNNGTSQVAKNSKHMEGIAADFKVEGYKPRDVSDKVQELIINGSLTAGGLGEYDTFTHYDIRGKNDRWGKNSERRKKELTAKSTKTKGNTNSVKATTVKAPKDAKMGQKEKSGAGSIKARAGNSGKVKIPSGATIMSRSYTPDLELLNNHATEKGYRVKEIPQAARYVAKYCTGSKSQSQCTRGIALFLQLASYARGEAKRKYVSACAAHLFGSTNPMTNYNISGGVAGEYTKSSGTATTGKGNMCTQIGKRLKNDGEFVTFQYSTSQHIVFRANGGWYSDFKQGTAAGCGGEKTKFKTIHYFKLG